MDREELRVSGMACTGCEDTVEDAIGNLEGVSRVTADHEEESVEIVADDSVSDDEIRETIESAGYEVAG